MEPHPGRARGRARGAVRRPPAGDEGQGPSGLSPPHRTSPPGRSLDPSQFGELSLEDMDPSQLARFGNGNGNGNGDGNGNGNGNGGNGNGNGGNGHEIDDDDESLAGDDGQWQAARAHVVARAAERYDFVATRQVGASSKVGTAGTVVPCFVNYFQATTDINWTMFHYRVDYSPMVDDSRVRRNLTQSLRNQPGFGNFICDGHSLWKAGEIGAALIQQVADGKEPETIYNLTFKLVAQMQPGDPGFIQIFNIITRSCLRILRLCMMGRNYFDPTAEISLPNYRIKLWPGFVTTLRHHDGGLLYCVELTNKVIRTDSCWIIMKNIRQEATRANTDFREAVTKEIVGSIVLTMYNNKTYRIDDIAWDTNPTSTFTLKDGRVVTFQDYYKRYSSHQLTALVQPLLVSNPKPRDVRAGRTDPIKLVPELCQMTGLNEKMRSDFTMMRDMAGFLFQPPQLKIDNTVAFMKRLLANPECVQEFTGWGMQMKSSPLLVNARTLPQESIFLRDKRSGNDPNGTRTEFPVQVGDFTNALRGNGFMIKSVELANWVMIVQQRDSSGIDNLVSTMQRVATNLGFQIRPPSETVILPHGSPDNYANAVINARSRYKALQLVFVVLPNNRLEAYSAVKRKCYIDFGLPSQCFLAKNVNNRGIMSIATKVVVQINAKLGGECWAMKIPIKSIMVIGFDVHHGGAGSTGGSFGAMVATTNTELNKFFSISSISRSREELSNNMSRDIEKCLTEFRKVNNGALPDRIIFYRDGVGQGQLNYVYTTELQSITLSLREVYQAAGREPVKFSMIICTKRINTRIFERKAQRTVDNPKPGTVLDTGVTLPERWDFLLIAQVARQGTVSPTNYNVIYDTNGLEADKIQRLTYKLCNMYFNWSGGVAVPAVVQYAHKMAFLTGTALGAPGTERLGHTLYYL